MTQRRARAAVVALLATGAALLAVQPSAAARPPVPTPVNASQAQDAAHAAAQQVTRAESGIRRAAARVRSAQRAAVDTQQSLQRQLSIQQSTAAAAARASTRADRTRQAQDVAHRAFVAIVTADFQGGTDEVTMIGDLLSAKDPAGVLAAGQRQAMVSQHHALVVAQAGAAAAADAAAQRERTAALRRVSTATALLQEQVRASTAAVRTTQRMLRGLRDEFGNARATQAQADAVLSSFLGGWTLTDPRAASELNKRYLRLVDERPDGPLPHARGWSADKGQTTAWRALAWIGTPYAWAGGNSSGPTTGVCAGGDAHNDCHLTGFDCSGLTLNAWAPYLALPHLASSQYRVAGRVHPGIDHLRPGDMVFWSSDGTAAGIHHVALYVGKGFVVQAPQSGDIVRVTPLASVDSGYFGATRPQS